MFVLTSGEQASVAAKRETLASVDNHRGPVVVPILVRAGFAGLRKSIRGDRELGCDAMR